jgi:RNA polymerase sigma-70 factor (ECF subfamily)
MDPVTHHYFSKQQRNKPREMKPAKLARLFVVHFPTPIPDDLRVLEATLADLLARSHAAWPDFALEPAPLLRYLAERISPAVALTAALASVHIEDLALAYACGRRDARAIAIVESTFLPKVARYIAHTGASDAMVSEAEQLLRVRLFVGQGGSAPEIMSYTGRGALGAWLRVVAVRIVRGLQRTQRRFAAWTPGEAAAADKAPADPERQYIKKRYARAIDAVLARVLENLPAKERSILSLHFLDGLSTDAIGKLFHVDGSTIRRHVAKIRQGIMTQARRELAKELRLQRSELESVLRLARSQLEVSVSRALQHRGS